MVVNLMVVAHFPQEHLLSPHAGSMCVIEVISECLSGKQQERKMMLS